GTVAKNDVARTYAGWHAAVMILPGGRYMTSGKVYELMATGLPILSVHEVEHDASVVLTGHPLWTPPVGFDPERLATALSQPAKLALSATEADRATARKHARQYERSALMAPAVRRIAALARPDVRPVPDEHDETPQATIRRLP